MSIHLLDTKDLTNNEVTSLLERAEELLVYSNSHDSDTERTYYDPAFSQILKNHIIITVFFENSTRTLSSFEFAAKRLGGSVVRLDTARSSTNKGETLFDTAANLNAMSPSAIVVRHQNAGVPNLLSKYTTCSIINGGDGAHAHPTQALLDMLTLKKHFGNLRGKKVAIVGDIKNSRVANSNIELLGRFGVELILVGPPHFLPKTSLRVEQSLTKVIDEVDAIISLRTQTERHELPIYSSLRDYAKDYCLTSELLKDRDIIILHPGPVHRNIDIEDSLLKDPRCKVLEQVTHGVAIRMAVLEYLICKKKSQAKTKHPYF